MAIKIPPELEEVPCFLCKLLPRCSSGHTNPLDCEKFSSWLKALAKSGLELEVVA